MIGYILEQRDFLYITSIDCYMRSVLFALYTTQVELKKIFLTILAVLIFRC